MLSPQQLYDLVKCYFSKGLIDLFLKREEKEMYLVNDDKNVHYAIPSELLSEFLQAVEAYFEQIFNKLRNCTIVISQPADRKIQISDVSVQIKGKLVPIIKFIGNIQFVR